MNEAVKISQNINYLSPYRYISGRIIEYDIKSANISCLRQGNFITEEDYQYLVRLPKQQREIEIGLRIKQDPKIYTNIQKGIKWAKKQLIECNNVDPESIIRIANDAVYINSTIDLPNIKFGEYIQFVPKSVSNIFLNLNKTILLLSFDNNGKIHVDVKGIGDNKIALHENYMISAIVTVIAYLERSGVQEAVSYLSELCMYYVRYELPIGYYREFNTVSSYRMKHIFGQYDPFNGDSFGADNLEEAAKYSLDINYNYSILRELWSILLEIYTMRVH